MSDAPPPLPAAAADYDEENADDELDAPLDAETEAGEQALDQRERQFPCGQCGGLLTFKPGAGELVCEYCGHANPIPNSEADIEELDFEAALKQPLGDADMQTNRVVKCGSCAAEFTLDPNIQADECPFCGADAVVDGGSNRQIKPKSLLPFKLDERAARAAFGKWLKRLWFAPDKVKKFASAERGLTGMYTPYWTYDAATTSYYRGQRGTNYTTTRTVMTKDGPRMRTVTRIRWRSVNGVVGRNFDDVLVVASRSLPTKYAERLEPWDLEHLKPYDDAYLSGFRAESHQVDLEQGFGRAKEIMETQIRKDVKRDIGGDHQRISSLRTSHRAITYKHVLLPVWVSAYRHGDKTYNFLVNARTGEVQGERPYSWAKIGAAVLGVAATAAIIWAVAEFLI